MPRRNVQVATLSPIGRPDPWFGRCLWCRQPHVQLRVEHRWRHEEQVAHARAEARAGAEDVPAHACAPAGAVRRSRPQALWAEAGGRQEDNQAFRKGGEVMLALLVDRFTCSLVVRTWRVLILLAGVCLALAATGPSVAQASFGIASFDGSLSSQDGSPDTQAGSHPYQASTKFALNTTSANGQTVPDGNFKDLRAELPAGLIGDPSATARCPQQDFFKYENGAPQTNCPVDSQVGLLVLKTTGLGTVARPVFNPVPPPGEPAQFGVVFFPAPVYIDAHVRSGGDYGLTVSLSGVSTLLPVFGSTLTIWGVPADPSHDALRGARFSCIGDPTNPAATSSCFGGGHSAGVAPEPFLTLPTSCAGPQTTRLSVG